MGISNGLLKWPVSVEPLEPTVDCSSAGVVLLGKFGLCDAVFVRHCRQQRFRRLLSLDVVECAVKFFDGYLVEMVHYKQQESMGKKF
jgi:hypothetical protein